MTWILSKRQYEALLGNAEIVARANQTTKVVRLGDGKLVKLFWLKHRISSAWIYPYSLRFARNARRLHARNIPCVEMQRTHFVPALRLHIAIYTPLPGRTLIELRVQDQLPQLAHFIAHLHQLGIYFRSLHFGNIVRLPDGRYGLIDVADMRFKHRPLRPSERVRNLLHLIRRPDNCKHLGWPGMLALLEHYLDACDRNGARNVKLNHCIERFKLMAGSKFS